MYGKKAWSNGLTKETDERVRQISEKNKGKKLSKEHRITAIKNLRPHKKGEFKHTEKTKRILHLKNKGKCFSPKTTFKKGHIPKHKRVELYKKIVECECGCGQTMNYLNKWGRPTKFIWGHNNKNKNYISLYGKDKAESLIESIKGGKHWNWNGGSSFEPYGLDFNEKFKESIRARDNYCCVLCNKSQEELGQKLSVHHVDYDKKLTLPQNAVSLCRPNHTLTNNNRSAWKTFFQALLKERYGYEYTKEQKIVLDFTKSNIIQKTKSIRSGGFYEK